MPLQLSVFHQCDTPANAIRDCVVGIDDNADIKHIAFYIIKRFAMDNKMMLIYICLSAFIGNRFFCYCPFIDFRNKCLFFFFQFLNPGCLCCIFFRFSLPDLFGAFFIDLDVFIIFVRGYDPYIVSSARKCPIGFFFGISSIFKWRRCRSFPTPVKAISAYHSEYFFFSASVNLLAAPMVIP